MFEQDMEKVLITREEIAVKVRELGKQITEEFKGEQLIVVCILRGSCVFYADLIRELELDVKLDFMVLSSYGDNSSTSGHVVVKQDLAENIKGKNVLVVEDIIDSGRTIKRLKEILLEREPKKLKIVTLLDKPSRREVDITTDFTGISIPDEFVVGYGLDFAQKYRNLKDICVLSPKVYK